MTAFLAQNFPSPEFLGHYTPKDLLYLLQFVGGGGGVALNHPLVQHYCYFRGLVDVEQLSDGANVVNMALVLAPKLWVLIQL